MHHISLIISVGLKQLCLVTQWCVHILPLASVNISSSCWLLFRCYLSSLCSFVLFSDRAQQMKVRQHTVRLNLKHATLTCSQPVLENVVPTRDTLNMVACAWIAAGFYLQTEGILSLSLTKHSWSVLVQGSEVLTAPVENPNSQLLCKVASRCTCTYLCNSNPPGKYYEYLQNQFVLANRGFTEGFIARDYLPKSEVVTLI